jgi:hypothetical protein
MSNQMIALQARGPKLADPAAQTAKFVNMMNMTKQQEAAERQAAQAQQAMDIEAAKEARAVQTQAATMREKDLDIEDKEMVRLYKIGAALLETEDPNAREAGYQNLLGMIEKTSPQMGATMRQVAPTFNPNVLQAVMMETEQYFNKKYPNAQATLEYTAKGQKDEQGNLIPEDTPVQVTTGMKPSTQVIRSTSNAASPASVAAPRTPTGSVPTGKFGATLVTPDSARPLTPYQQDHIRQMQEGLGMSNTPASFSPGASAGQMAPDMVPAILDSAVKTGVMAQIDLDQIIAMAPPQARQGIMDVIRTNKIALQADAPSLAASGMGQQQMAPNPVQRPQSQFADMRGPAPQSQTAGLRGAPPMEQTLAQYIAVKRKEPNVGAYPGSALVAPQVLGSQKAAETAGSENVKVGTEPRIVAGTERAKRLEKLRGEMPVAKAETQTLVNSLTGRINAIDEYLRSGSRNSIIGVIEGRIPRALQSETRADAQGLYDYITSNTVLQKLIDDRGQTETGGSPQGVVSDADLKVAAQASTKLTQTGSERKQEIEMQRLRDELYRTREIAIQKYNNVYREVMKEAPELRLKVRTVAPKYKSAPQTSTKRKPLQNIFGG